MHCQPDNRSDHRRLGERLSLFHFEDGAPGGVFWHPRGHVLYRAVEDYVRARMRRDGYREIRSPHLLSLGLWEQSGHRSHYGDNMYVVGEGPRALALKPMNCPGHIKVYNHGVRSWRDLPFRVCEFGQCHRNEPSGAMHGLMRLRGFMQDDGHIFCSPEQADEEVVRFCRLLASIYKDFGFSSFRVGLSLRPDDRAASDEVWDVSERALASAVRNAGFEPVMQPGEGAFYGPKLEFHLEDSAGRSWQCGTLQYDMVLPSRMNCSYRDPEGGQSVPVLLHRAVLGSLERFIGILLEHHEGNLPVWLAPEQARVISVSEGQADYAIGVRNILEDAGLRSEADVSRERLPAKVRAAASLKVPVQIVVGEAERKDALVSLRREGGSEVVPIARGIELIRQVIDEKGHW